jgi:hypothetical protein
MNRRPYMRALLGAIVSAVTLAFVAIALAETKTTYEQGFTKSKAGSSVGTSLKFTSIDTDKPQTNEQPTATRRLDVLFPAGTKIDQKAKPFCAQLDEAAEEPCPPNTRIGGGSAEMRLMFPGTGVIPTEVTAYNRRNGLWLHVVPQVPFLAPVVLKPQFKGLRLTTPIPPLCEQNDCVQNGEAVLARFELRLKAAKKRMRRFMKTPKTCTKKGWTFKAVFTYADGTRTSHESGQDCRPN